MQFGSPLGGDLQLQLVRFFCNVSELAAPYVACACWRSCLLAALWPHPAVHWWQTQCGGGLSVKTNGKLLTQQLPAASTVRQISALVLGAGTIVGATACLFVGCGRRAGCSLNTRRLYCILLLLRRLAGCVWLRGFDSRAAGCGAGLHVGCARGMEGWIAGWKRSANSALGCRPGSKHMQIPPGQIQPYPWLIHAGYAPVMRAGLTIEFTRPPAY